MFTPPGGPTYLPGEYIIYLSREDDLLWQGRKREGLAEGLRHSLAIRAREMVGDKPLRTERLIIALGADGTLEKGQVRVQEVWDDDSPRTEVAPRARPARIAASIAGIVTSPCASTTATWSIDSIAALTCAAVR